MKSRTIATVITLSALLGSAAVMAAGDSNTDRSNPSGFVKDSAITTKIKTKLAADPLTSVAKIKVDTDKDGVVWMSGSAETQAAVDQALSMARGTEGVKNVHSDVTVQ